MATRDVERDGDIYGTPIEAGEMRLLDLSISNKPTVEGCLIPCELGSASYVAISYVWGNENDRLTMHLNNRPVSVTKSAYNVLNLLSQASSPVIEGNLAHLSMFANKLIWIDAICINQQDNDEKAAQVRQMGEIYRQAERK